VVRVRFRLADLPDGLEAEPVSALATDLCEGGIYMSAPLAARLTRGARVELEIDAGRHGRIRARACVARLSRADGVGIFLGHASHLRVMDTSQKSIPQRVRGNQPGR